MGDLTIKKVMEAKRKLRKSIFERVEVALKEFESETGISPSGISVHIMPLISIDGTVSNHLSDVSVDVSL